MDLDGKTRKKQKTTTKTKNEIKPKTPAGEEAKTRETQVEKEQKKKVEGSSSKNMPNHIGSRQLYPIKGGYYVPAETLVLLQDFEEQYWPEIVSIVASYTQGYSSKVSLSKEEAATLLAKFPKKEKTELQIDERMQKILLALVERSPRRIWEVAEIVEPPLQKGRRIIPSPQLRAAIKKMNGSLVMSTKSEVELTEAGFKAISKIVGPERIAEAQRCGAEAKAAREQDLQQRREQHFARGML